MKTTGLIFLFLSVFFLSSCEQKEESESHLSTDLVSEDDKYPVMEFEEQEYDFGKITEGETVSHIFTFKNTGEADLLVSEARASCGCTVPEHSKEPIKPGEKGKITVKFDSKGKEGVQKKSVTVIANTKPINNELHIMADVQKQESKQ